MSDTELLNCLQILTDQIEYTGKVIMRRSNSGRGWRLHETSSPRAKESVREAIEDFIRQERIDLGLCQ